MTNTSAQVGAYVGDGGVVIHLDESRTGVPADPLMAKQVVRGALRHANPEEAEGQGVVHARPAANAGVGQWRDWAVANGLAKYEAEGMSKKALQLWAVDNGADDLEPEGGAE